VLDLADDLPAWIIGDEVRLCQILLNLLSNAVKFTDRGSVRLTIRRQRDARSDRLTFAVTDTGIGIPADRRHLLFQSFSQIDRSTHRRYGGSGLGLAISKRLVEAMSGEIRVDSDTAKGSTFAFTLPMEEVLPPVSAVARGKRRKSAAPSLILVAEDIPLNQMIVEAILIGAGHEVVLVRNGLEALEAMKSRSFDIVLMDIEMPKMDGLTATRAIRASGSDYATIPIIALTANAMDEQIQSCREAGMTDHVAKPIDQEQLLAAVAKWAVHGSRYAARQPDGGRSPA
jgi:CheY-like chemotaxis protein